MRLTILLLISQVFVSAGLAQNLVKSIDERFDNGKKRVVNYYRKVKDPSNLAKREVFAYDGKMIREENYTGGRKHGSWKEWKEFDGTLITELNYVNDELDGEQKYFFSDGRIKRKLNYLAGRMEGRQVEFFFKEGTDSIKIEHNYSGGILHGMQRQWQKDGKLLYNYNFVAGKPEGLQRKYDESGNMTEQMWKQGVYEEVLDSWTAAQPKMAKVYDFQLQGDSMNIELGRSLQKMVAYYESGAINGITVMSDPPETQEFHLNGKVKGKGKGTLDKREGVWEFWHENGQKMMEGAYLDGKKTGMFVTFNDKGGKVMEEMWSADGSKRDSWKVYFYYSGGKKESEGALDANGHKTGPWKHWHANGTKKIEATWEKACAGGGGRPFATSYTEWDESGKMLMKGNEGDMRVFEYYPGGGPMVVKTVLYTDRDPCVGSAIDVYKDGRMVRSLKSAPGYNKSVVLEKISLQETGDTTRIDRFNADGKRHGKQEGWYSDGKRHYSYNFTEGRCQGRVKEWYPTGEVMMDHKYKSALGGPPKLVEGTYYNEKGKDYYFNDTSGKSKKKAMLEIENASYFVKFIAENL